MGVSTGLHRSLLGAFALFCLVAIVVRAQSDIQDCTFGYQNQFFDVSPLIASNGSYTWKQTLYTQDLANLVSGQPLQGTEYWFELNFCRPVVSAFDSCDPLSPINMISIDGVNCTSLGSLDLAIFDIAPYNNGLYLSYLHGDAVSNVQTQSARVYIICNEETEEPYVEHQKVWYEWHFRINTPYGCPANKN